jgi:hypothetical protein
MGDEMTISVGWGGWVEVSGLDQMPGRVYLRLRPDDRGRLRVQEFYLDSSEDVGLSVSDLRRVPIGQVETICNEEGLISPNRLNTPAPDLSTYASFYASSFGNYREDRVRSNWVHLAFLSQFDEAVLVREGYGDVARGRPRKPTKRKPRPRTAPPDLRLRHGPGTDGLSDAFLEQVAAAYYSALRRGERPNVTLANDSGQNVKTVQRWIYTARKRGVMDPPPKKGTAG